MEKAFTALINTHRGIIFKVCNMYCPDKEYREDLFQEIVLQLWRAFPAFRNESKISTWMYRVALNTAISSFRKESKRVEGKSISHAEFEIPALESITDEDGHLGVLREAIQQLSKIEKGIIMLYLEEKSYEEISDIIGITKTNVGVKVNRIKVKLGKIIKAATYGAR